jgi:outer membrane autotransporter protein
MKRKDRKLERRLRPNAIILIGGLAFNIVLLIALARSVQAQTFNQAINTALTNPPLGACDPRINPVPGGNLSNLCGQNASPGGSNASTTALSNEISAIEERKIERVVGPFNVFMSGEYERFRKNVTTFEPGYKSDSWRVAVGSDYSFNPQFLAGALFNYGNDNGNFDSGGRFDTDSYGFQLFANFAPTTTVFISTALGYTRKNYFASRIAINNAGPRIVGAAAGDTDGNEVNADVKGGYDFRFNNITIGPRLGLNYKYTGIDGYRERGNTGLELRYNSQNVNSLHSTIGMFGSIAISTSFGVLVPQTSLEYKHEFLDPQRKIHFSFAEDQNSTLFRFQNDPPDRNYFNLGAGVVLQLARGIAPFINYRALVGYKEQRSHIATAGVRVEF